MLASISISAAKFRQNPSMSNCFTAMRANLSNYPGNDYIYPMPPYHLQSEDFALSDEGVHLLRSGFNFKTIPYNEIKQATLRRDVEIKRPLIILCLGLAM